MSFSKTMVTRTMGPALIFFSSISEQTWENGLVVKL